MEGDGLRHFQTALLYKKNLKRSTIFALLIIIFIFQAFPKFNLVQPGAEDVVFTTLTIEDIPVTRQGTRLKPPPKPAVPIPSEDDLIPDDITIEKTELDLNLYPEPIGDGWLSGAPVIFQPRPIYEVIPEYSQELQKKGIQGRVKLHLYINEKGLVEQVVVLENTTGSQLCAEAAKRAAQKGRYLPAKKSGKPTDIWITRSYTFGFRN
ncbi:MAG TPA: energy transducer TonB [bacterium]|nr:energy transducer TonB [bacterium]